ncbi:hypothetical protein D1113_02875 [Mycoplasmopsis gallopavonis]|uniref:Transmembrane protein n=2 Tax=Mycoplasmopsis gallopavonis TaxID=76629 RepID=A0A449AZF6_9BACT|nr:hypothetical protein D1113_02875 [Mycoplasmopsis gallopavonis]VEU72881.1 Uncharacterised protein [Mycoplasmopsis gallopavonis]
MTDLYHFKITIFIRALLFCLAIFIYWLAQRWKAYSIKQKFLKVDWVKWSCSWYDLQFEIEKTDIKKWVFSKEEIIEKIEKEWNEWVRDFFVIHRFFWILSFLLSVVLFAAPNYFLLSYGDTFYSAKVSGKITLIWLIAPVLIPFLSLPFIIVFGIFRVKLNTLASTKDIEEWKDYLSKKFDKNLVENLFSLKKEKDQLEESDLERYKMYFLCYPSDENFLKLQFMLEQEEIKNDQIISQIQKK